MKKDLKKISEIAPLETGKHNKCLVEEDICFLKAKSRNIENGEALV